MIDARSFRDLNVFDDGLISTLVGRCLTVTDTVADARLSFLYAVTVIVAVPSPVEVTLPSEETVATDVLLLDQLKVAPDTMYPL